MEDIYGDSAPDLIFIIILTVFVKSNIAKFGQYEGFSKIKNYLLLKTPLIT